MLVVAPTQHECEAVTNEVREGLRQRNKLGKEEHPFQRLKNIHDTEAERRDVVTYRPGQVIQFTQNVPALRRGGKLTVVGLGQDGSVDVRRSSGEHLALPLRFANKFQRYEMKEVGFAIGDPVRITQNGYDESGKHRLNNGDDRHTVTGFTRDDGIKLENGWVIPKDFGHIMHGYATTSHSSQGKSGDRVLVAQGSESFTATHREQFYASVSRGKESVTLYSDNKTQLREEIKESGRRMSAVKMMQDIPEARKERILGHAELNARLKVQAEANASRSFEALQERYGPTQLAGAGREESTRGGEYER